jgi:hypothetical protein
MILVAKCARRKEMAKKQRKSKFAININKAGTDEVTMQLVNDLLRKYPRGIEGRLGSKLDYVDSYSSDPHASSTGDFCGYTWEQLWVLTNEYIKDGTSYGVIDSLCVRHWSWSGEKSRNQWGSSYMPSATNTRRARRLMGRLGQIARHWREKGRKAIYRWKPDYSSGHLRGTPFYVWGNDMKDASAQVSTVWIPILNATGLAGSDSHGREVILEANSGNIKMYTETADSSMTATSAFDTMQNLLDKRQKILNEITIMQQTVGRMSDLIEFVSHAAEG